MLHSVAWENVGSRRVNHPGDVCLWKCGIPRNFFDEFQWPPNGFFMVFVCANEPSEILHITVFVEEF